MFINALVQQHKCQLQSQLSKTNTAHINNNNSDYCLVIIIIIIIIM